MSMDYFLINQSSSPTSDALICQYRGTDFSDEKMLLIGIFAVALALLSISFNSFFTMVFILNPSLKRTPVYYFGMLAIVDIIMALNYIALMAIPVYMDHYKLLWLYAIFLSYLRVFIMESNIAIFSSMMLILSATTERLLRTSTSQRSILLRKAMERNRPTVCLICVGIGILYKFCTYFEIHYVELKECTGFAQYDIQQTTLALNSIYNFWWMFIARNVIDRILPFVLLVAMNFSIIRGLKRKRTVQTVVNFEDDEMHAEKSASVKVSISQFGVFRVLLRIIRISSRTPSGFVVTR